MHSVAIVCRVVNFECESQVIVIKYLEGNEFVVQLFHLSSSCIIAYRYMGLQLFGSNHCTSFAIIAVLDIKLFLRSHHPHSPPTPPYPLHPSPPYWTLFSQHLIQIILFIYHDLSSSKFLPYTLLSHSIFNLVYPNTYKLLVYINTISRHHNMCLGESQKLRILTRKPIKRARVRLHRLTR